MNNKLKKTIQNQFQTLETRLDNIRNWQIELDEDMWDSQYYWDLLNELKELVLFLEKDKGLLENLELWNNNNDDEEE